MARFDLVRQDLLAGTNIDQKIRDLTKKIVEKINDRVQFFNEQFRIKGVKYLNDEKYELAISYLKITYEDGKIEKMGTGFNLGFCYLKMNDLKNALKYSREALEHGVKVNAPDHRLRPIRKQITDIEKLME